MTNLIIKNLNINIDKDIISNSIFNNSHDEIQKLLKEIKKVVIDFCLHKNINIEKQEYLISGNIENIDISDKWYSLCTDKYFNFFGKYYFDHNYDGIDIFKNDKEIYNNPIKDKDLVVCMHHFYNKTISKEEKKYLEFYIAPKALLSNFDLGQWTKL
jgi:hypothetical protein